MTTNEPRAVWCRHHERIPPLGHRCAIGVDIDAICPPGQFGRHYMLPCHTSESPGCAKVACDKRDLFTPAEIAAKDAEDAKWIAMAERRLLATLPLIERIKKTHAGRGAQGVEACPICGCRLEWAIAASNGHIRMRCVSSDDCINFIE